MTSRRPAVVLVSILACLFLFVSVDPALACTTAVVSGKATADGRPLLWKNRDADDDENQVIYREDGRYPYVGVVNRGDVLGLQVWAGVNAKGFAIINSASYNLESKETEDEGRFMRLALQTCATLADFEALLAATDRSGRDVSANFGVIDALGGAAYFEAGLHAHRRFDANDAAVAPDGVIVRSNYSDGAPEKGSTGFLRRQRATALIDGLVRRGALDARSLLADVARDDANARLGSNPRVPRAAGAPAFAYVGDSICREITSNVTLFAGVKPGEDPLLSTMWTILGQPLTGAAVPVWVAAKGVPAELAAGPEPAPLNAACNDVRARMYPARTGELKRYVEVDRVVELGPKLVALEATTFDEVAKALAKPADAATLNALQAAIAKRTLAGMRAIVPAK